MKKTNQKIALTILLCFCVGLTAVAAAFGESADGKADRFAAYLAEQQSLENEKGLLIQYWSIEDIYAFCEKYDDVVNPPENPGPRHSLPQEDELSQAQAREAILGIVKEKHGENALASDLEWVEIVFFQEQITGQRTWEFIFAHPNAEDPSNPEYVYDVQIDAKTGELTYFADGLDGWG